MSDFGYYPKSDKYPVASASCKEWDTANSLVKFSELRIAQNDDWLSVFMYVDSFTGLKNFYDKTWKFAPETIAIHFAKTGYRKKVGDDWKTVQPSEVEQFVVKNVGSLDDTKAYKGFFTLSNSPFLAKINGNLAEGEAALPESTLVDLLATMINLEETETELINKEIVKAKKKGSGNFGGKFESESEKLLARLQFIRDQLTANQVDYTVTTVMDIHPNALLKCANDELSQKVSDIIEACRFLW